jgi:uncharacterized protein (TIGR02145 family)
MMDYNPSDTGIIGTTQGICPAGWHIPTENEWEVLAYYLGGFPIAGGPLKETGFAHWQSPNEGATNETGFTALPGGEMYRDDDFSTTPTDNKFGGIGRVANFWASRWDFYESLPIEYGTEYWLMHTHFSMNMAGQPTFTGESVRCIKDP